MVFCFECFMCFIWSLYGQLCESQFYIIALASIAALLMLCNVHTSFMMCTPGNGCALDVSTTTSSAVGAGYDYSVERGPHTWHVAESNQSPINIESREVQRINFDMPLNWVGYDKLPLGVRLENNGHTLLLRAAYDGASPFIDGADLLSCFSFHEISFRWSWHDGEGSEHTLDNQHYPLEMQCLHTDAADRCHASSRGLLVVSYLFTLSVENPFLNVIIRYLVAVQQAGQCAEIPPFPLNYLMPTFYSDFYSYQGSLTEPPCHRGAEWFISPIPLAISERQLHEFRKLRSRSGSRIERNARPVQDLCDRIVNLNRYRRV
ncbi:CG9235 [Drosophila busckii]|uniref:CG9235 n=1 Tax=Drosophila busckii TaxID=30019 RepID=A0A0M3QV96_DROBS|nr:putative carbonic anhydrase 3 [Drosophila busckii]ALC41993.1 CG9235 [Drosophila busckii]